MVEPVVGDQHDNGMMPVADAAPQPLMRLATTLVDGAGGELALVLSDDGAHLLADAIGILAVGQPSHGSVIKVTTRERVFVLSRTVDAAGDPIIRVCDLYNPQACVNLSVDLAELVAVLLSVSERLWE